VDRVVRTGGRSAALGVFRAMHRDGHSRSSRPDAAGNLLQVELLQEKAANLGRLARRLERALQALAAYDVEVASRGSSERGGSSGSSIDASGRRRALLVDAGDALFLYVVQREVLGLRGTAQALDEIGVPREVRLRMAPRSVLLAR
jgi:hypothetical protein